MSGISIEKFSEMAHQRVLAEKVPTRNAWKRHAEVMVWSTAIERKGQGNDNRQKDEYSADGQPKVGHFPFLANTWHSFLVYEQPNFIIIGQIGRMSTKCAEKTKVGQH